MKKKKRPLEMWAENRKEEIVESPLMKIIRIELEELEERMEALREEKPYHVISHLELQKLIKERRKLIDEFSKDWSIIYRIPRNASKFVEERMKKKYGLNWEEARYISYAIQDAAEKGKILNEKEALKRARKEMKSLNKMAKSLGVAGKKSRERITKRKGRRSTRA